MRCLSSILTCAAAAFVAVGAGCVPQDRYDNLLTSYRTLQEENVAAQSELEAAESNANMLRDRLNASTRRIDELLADNQRMRGDFDRLGQEYEALLRRVDNIDVAPLPPELDQALRTFAAQHPGLLTYDPRLGMVRFASDLTFALGSADLSQPARQSLQAFARILNDAAASGFEVRVIGHTDNVPIGRPETRANHPTNVHLSVHRAISVRSALVSANVDPRRVQVAGYGEFRPIVANTPSGAAQNRRVEIFLVPMATPLDNLPEAGTATPGQQNTPPRTGGDDIIMK